jgi:hypothetical protein
MAFRSGVVQGTAESNASHSSPISQQHANDMAQVVVDVPREPPSVEDVQLQRITPVANAHPMPELAPGR